MKKGIILVGLLALSTTACTDAEMAKLTALGDTATIECYSGEKLIFSSKSTGKVSSEPSSDGYFFKDAKDGKLKEVSGNCIITYD